MSYQRVPTLIARKNYGVGAVPVRRRRPRALNERTSMGETDIWGNEITPTPSPSPDGGGGPSQVFNTDYGKYVGTQAGPLPGMQPSGGGSNAWANIAQGAGAFVKGIFGGGAAYVQPQAGPSLGTIVPILAIGGIALVLLTRKKS